MTRNGHQVKRSAKAKWTVMVYMAGDNNLDSAALRDIAEMAQVGSSKKVHIVVQLDRDKDLLTRRFYITQGGGYKKDCILTFDEANTGDPKILENFILWAINTYPARRYFLILWNHGGGWWEQARVKAPATPSGSKARSPLFATSVRDDPNRSIAYDDTSGDALDNQELKNVLSRISQKIGKKIDILGMDACLMNMIEVAYQLKDSVQVMVGSEDEEPFDGWPYHKILQVLKNRPRCWPTTIAKMVVKEYIKSYQEKGETVTQSALNLKRLRNVVQRLDTLSLQILATFDHDASYRAVGSSWRISPKFFWNNYVDLCSFAKNLRHRSPQETIKKEAARLTRALKPGRRKTILHQEHLGQKVKDTHGISIYFPSTWVNPKYRELDFYRDCNWGKLLDTYLLT